LGNYRRIACEIASAATQLHYKIADSRFTLSRVAQEGDVEGRGRCNLIEDGDLNAMKLPNLYRANLVLSFRKEEARDSDLVFQSSHLNFKRKRSDVLLLYRSHRTPAFGKNHCPVQMSQCNIESPRSVRERQGDIYAVTSKRS
jgi:hypothetical protein